MDLRHYLDRCKMEIYGPGRKWEGTWMEERQYSLALDSDGPGPGWKWDVHFETCVGLRRCLYGSAMQLLGPGWRWDVTWMEVICNYGDLGWGETRSGWRLVVNLGGSGWSWEEGGWQWDTNASIPGWGYSWALMNWDAIIVTKIKVRLDQDASETLPGWRWDANQWTSMAVRVYIDGGEMYIS